MGASTGETRPAPEHSPDSSFPSARNPQPTPLPGAPKELQYSRVLEFSLRRRGAPTQAPSPGPREVRRRSFSSSPDPGGSVVRRRSVLPPRPRAQRLAQARLAARTGKAVQRKLDMSGLRVASRLLRTKRLALTGTVSQYRGLGPVRLGWGGRGRGLGRWSLQAGVEQTREPRAPVSDVDGLGTACGPERVGPAGPLERVGRP